MPHDRRAFLSTLTAAGAAALLGRPPLLAAAPTPPPRPRVRLAIASYSYWHFRTAKVPIETVMDRAADLGVAGVDILHRQMDLTERAPLDAAGRAYLRGLKRHAFRRGLEICCVSTHQSFVKADPGELTAEVEHTKKCIELAAELGCPSIRINTGRWGTTRSFDELMKNRGIEPILPGRTEDEGFKWCIDGITRCLPKAEECGVVLALENHWGLARTAAGLLRILNAIKSPWLGGLLDTGNFLDDIYAQQEAIAPHTVYVQAKTYPGGGEWYSLDLDYPRIAALLGRAGYQGWVALEMEGKEDSATAVPKSLATLRAAFGVG
ncbi:MAG: sugar phosphate isomerase/epimerase family protein [Opitutaceae bacterium]|nr:sugar phosphate isomerase/epimerase family protein [Opitutaceae bacterium]